ncbi:MAG: response regulator transcription factor [Gemmatimonadaceae bacterium]|nr:response regulator transcription factor [Gemmatimonadaceae bacterium]
MSLRVVVLGQVPAPLAAQLPAMLSAMDLSLVAQATDRRAALAALTATPLPDIALLAATLADGAAFSLVRELPAAQRPAALVAIGTKEEEAVAAFDVQATDFVLWPADASRVEEALTRARQVVVHRALARTADELQRLIGEASALGVLEPVAGAAGDGRRRRHFGGAATGTLVASNPWRNGSRPDARSGRAAGAGDESVLDLSREDGGRAGQATPPLRVLVREGRRTRFVPLAEVDWFEADGNYIRVHAAGETYRTRGTITAIENALDPRQFVRIHRRIVVNMDRVREMSPLPGGDGLLVLGDGSTLRLSRTYRARVR